MCNHTLSIFLLARALSSGYKGDNEDLLKKVKDLEANISAVSSKLVCIIYLRLRGIMIGRHFHANISVQTAMCKDNNNSKSRVATYVKFDIYIK